MEKIKSINFAVGDRSFVNNKTAGESAQRDARGTRRVAPCTTATTRVLGPRHNNQFLPWNGPVFGVLGRWVGAGMKTRKAGGKLLASLCTVQS